MPSLDLILDGSCGSAENAMNSGLLTSDHLGLPPPNPFKQVSCRCDRSKMGREVELLIDETTIAASGTSEKVYRIHEAKNLTITGRCTYGAGATAALKIWVLASADGTDWDDKTDTEALGQFSLPTGDDETKQKSSPIPVDVTQQPRPYLWPSFIKVVAENLDGSVATGAVKVWATLDK